MSSPDPDILVRRCTVRVRRRDGWAWGDPDEVLDDLLARLDEVLADAVEQAGATGCDVVLRDPVRLTIDAGGVGVAGASIDDSELVERLREHVRRTAGDGAPSVVDPPSPAGTSQGAAGGEAGQVVAAARAPALGGVLADWSRTGRLPALVAAWPRAVRQAWIRWLEAAGADPGGAPRAWNPAAVDAIAARLGVGPHAATDAESQLLLLAGALAAAGQDRLPDATALAEARRLVGAAATGPQPGDPAGTRAETPSTQAALPADVSPDPPRANGGDPGAPAVVPALPFLVVLQLHRLGYIAPAAAMATVQGLPDADAHLAAMLAGKVLPPPTHGWQREPADRDAVALVAGRPVRDIEEVVAGWAPVAADAAAALAPVLVALYADDLDPLGLVVTRLDGGGWLCGEPSGLPVGWGTGDDEPAAMLAQLGHPAVAEDDRFAGLAAALEPRRGVPGPGLAALERPLGAAVGAALGSLALELWGPDADAPLALERFEDLDARVTVAEGGVTVALPRGQRWLDLRRIGLLDAWPVPWSPGGRWELVTW